MKIRDSGMPDEAMWEGFFDPVLTLRRLQFAVEREDVVDFGCGYGTFSIAAAQFTKGAVYALDIDATMVAATDAKARHARHPHCRRRSVSDHRPAAEPVDRGARDEPVVSFRNQQCAPIASRDRVRASLAKGGRFSKRRSTYSYKFAHASGVCLVQAPRR